MVRRRGNVRSEQERLLHEHHRLGWQDNRLAEMDLTAVVQKGTWAIDPEAFGALAGHAKPNSPLQGNVRYNSMLMVRYVPRFI